MKAVPLAVTGCPVHFTIDEDVLPLVSRWRWQAHRKPGDGYRAYRRVRNAARHRNGGKAAIWLHRLIVNAPDGSIVDHINGDTTDNRRSNLRIVTQRINSQNRHRRGSSTGFPCVYRSIRKKVRPYYVRMTDANGDRVFGGYYDTLEQAVAVSRSFARQLGVEWLEHRGAVAA